MPSLIRILLLLLLLATSVRADTALRMELEDLVERAGLVVEARVVSARGVLDAQGLVCTDYSLEVLGTIYGEHLASRTVRLPGGVLPDGRGTIVPGIPRLLPGDEVVLLLTERGSRGWRVPVGAAQGVFFATVDENGVRRARSRISGLATVGPDGKAETSSPARPVEYSLLVRRLERAASAKREKLEALRAEREEQR